MVSDLATINLRFNQNREALNRDFSEFIKTFKIFNEEGIFLLFRYTNRNRDQWGQSTYEHGITCRNILTDPHVHSQLKQNHANNPYYKQ